MVEGKLRRSGLEGSIDPVVDVTNYVLMEPAVQQVLLIATSCWWYPCANG